MQVNRTHMIKYERYPGIFDHKESFNKKLQGEI